MVTMIAPINPKIEINTWPKLLTSHQRIPNSVVDSKARAVGIQPKFK